MSSFNLDDIPALYGLTGEIQMIRRHDIKQSVKQAAFVAAVGQMCAVVEPIIPAPANRPENGHDTEVPGMA